MTIQVEGILEELRKKRPVFHSEADFQHSLAWEIHCHFPSAAIRLEKNFNLSNKREYLDIGVEDAGTQYAIELKYKTRKCVLKHNGEQYNLLSHGAQDVGRYDFIKDILRLERFVESHPNAVGYAIFLTNDDNYWNKTKRLVTADAMFRLHETRILDGELRWSEATGLGTMKGREDPLILKGTHSIRWNDFSEFEGIEPRKFRYVLLKVCSQLSR